jgi:hypothetical protein
VPLAVAVVERDVRLEAVDEAVAAAALAETEVLARREGEARRLCVARAAVALERSVVIGEREA